MTLMGYTSRNIPSPQVFENVLETRMKAKANGDKALNYALKLVVNTTYGAMLNQYNDLYDPLMGRSVCITGQLFLLELTEHLYQDIESLTIIQNNTDGLMVEFDEEDYPKVQEIVQEWQDRTGFELEEDKIIKIVQKDVNNYVEIQEDGKPKAKGGYLVRGIAPAGAFNINNNACIIATALKEYFVKGTPVEETINGCNDITQFQLIAKAGSKYSKAYQIVDGEEVPTQKVNRVYATKDERYGKLYKVKASTGAVAKIESLPDHCIIDNDNHLTIDSVDKEYYISIAKSRINDFIGNKQKKGRKAMNEEIVETVQETPEKTEKEPKTRKGKTPEKKLNVFSKLLKARLDFLNAGCGKSGKNNSMEFKYFELEDIVPTATRIFTEVGLIALPQFFDTTAELHVVDVDNPTDEIVFHAPFNQIQPIVSKAGNMVTNEMMAEGSSITYMRRYLYMIALDICEPDAIDSSTGAEPKTEAPKAPVSPEKREAITVNLTNNGGKATDLQVRQLKDALKSLIAKDPTKAAWVSEQGVKTQAFTQITKAECESLMKEVGKMLKGGDEA